MATKKPKHLNPQTTKDMNYLPKRTMPGVREVVELREESWFSVGRGIAFNFVAFLFFSALILAALYTALSATLMMYTPTGNGDERSLVVRNMWQDTGNIPPVEEQVVISATTPLPDPVRLAMMGWTGIPNVATVEVLSGAFDQIQYSNGTVTTVAGEEYETAVTESGEVQLEDELLVRCVAGDCEPNEAFVISVSQLYGEAR